MFCSFPHNLYSRINLHTVRDDTLLDSKAYKTYLDYATRKVPPKKAMKFKNTASPKLKTVTASPKEPTQKGERYHPNKFHGHQSSAQEYFNMKHVDVGNVIERCFGLLKGRWKILASSSFFHITTQVRSILVCCLLRNLIRKYMRFYSQELTQDEEDKIQDGRTIRR
uniref:DDE Tnp4 domain-containing protein n=1 Tax=Tanacetum cinerariifolium TaxID=118510 RepID=A0A699I4M5_TANCI|nr:hypothetical protein [Tanacetum cinerariifolium]